MTSQDGDDQARLAPALQITTRDFAAAPLTQAVTDTAVPTATATVTTPERQSHHAHFADDPAAAGTGPTLSPPIPIRRRFTRANTFKSIEDFSEFDMPRRGWQPGAEPGLDPYKTDGGHGSMLNLTATCEITVVDFSHDDIDVKSMTNETLSLFLKEPQPEWARCRWINVNGLSWDVIATLGKYKRLHKLSIEDIMNTRNRTKTDWYANHAFVIFTMLKLAHVCDQTSSDDDSDADSDARSQSGRSARSNRGSRITKGISKSLRSMFGMARQPKRPQRSEKSMENGLETLQHLKAYETGLSEASGETLERTLQRYQAGPNEAKIEYFEKHSALAPHQLGVIAEQVSMFITNDNTIISFFELSADVVEKPILKRLYTNDTVLRQSCDASMVGQAIIDAAIDLAIPVASVYADVIGDLELDVLTRPDVTHTKKLYIVINEINKVLAIINPVVNLINALRDHKSELSQESAALHLQDPSRGVIITPMTHTYLGDVLDHCVLITESLNSIKAQADGLIDLIFNTISAYQNESMKQLTLATIFFLPLTFLTGYFGQNFQPFDDLDRGILFFWKIAVPMSFATVLVLMRHIIWDGLKNFMQRRHILRARKTRRKANKKKRL
ncbi:hypothetical protein M406DRAFT_335962 [Cryphonectria parasitica EP155]|uniref:Magnesium and cobalt transporter CorA n=1 Tax=Cryphonectria parasitica (strain ATCC 38755 / EP155) TaxID=660469 RepID=A0A9P5CUR4_CRYP1|nr:uncharacterized protein M406DRAFT_335962 [Cryphonectria parasitica EP155]KAF3770255.1 hypothetical protein M406DRAFT_335962 [Cryphonectria parasitica EP155]